MIKAFVQDFESPQPIDLHHLKITVNYFVVDENGPLQGGNPQITIDLDQSDAQINSFIADAVRAEALSHGITIKNRDVIMQPFGGF